MLPSGGIGRSLSIRARCTRPRLLVPAARGWTHLAECPPVDRRLANRNIRTALIAGLICMIVFAASFGVAFVY